MRAYRTFLLVLAIVGSCLLLIAACEIGGEDDDDDHAADDDDDDDDGYPIDEVEVEWFPCSLYEGADDGRAECASTQMPFYWEDPDSGTFTSYAKRLLSKSPESQGQLWLLHGGPGASGVIGLTYMMEDIQDHYPELDLYTLDPRGTGYSEYVDCPDQESFSSDEGANISLDELDDCVAYLEETYGDGLRVFNTTYSAIDLAAYIHATKQEGKKVLIWGGSGGTFWGQRYLHLFPDQASGLVLEGIVPPDFSLGFQDEYCELVNREILDRCAADAFCSSKLPDPATTLQDLYDKIEGGHCPDFGISVLEIKQVLDYLSYYHPHHATIPAFIYRMDRCDAADVQALSVFMGTLFGGFELPISFSMVLFYNEALSEMWEHWRFPDNDAFLEYLDGIYEDAFIATGKGYLRNDYYLGWPVYSDPLDDLWAESDVPMLMIQGMIDPSTPYDFSVTLADHFTGAHQHYVAFPHAPHNVASGTPVSDDYYDMHCGQRLFIDFLMDPTGELDTSCVEDTVPLDFEGDQFGEYFFGTPDYWENPEEGSTRTPPASLPASLKHVEAELARLLRTTCPELERLAVPR